MNVVPDTSAWVEFLRGTGHPAGELVRDSLRDKRDIVFLTECVQMEILAGAERPEDLESLEQTIAHLPVIPLVGIDDYKEAARIYRDCRRSGITLRSQIDCLIAVPVIRAKAALIHNDRDFDAIARHSDLHIYR